MPLPFHGGCFWLIDHGNAAKPQDSYQNIRHRVHKRCQNADSLLRVRPAKGQLDDLGFLILPDTEIGANLLNDCIRQPQIASHRCCQRVTGAYIHHGIRQVFRQINVLGLWLCAVGGIATLAVFCCHCKGCSDFAQLFCVSAVSGQKHKPNTAKKCSCNQQHKGVTILAHRVYKIRHFDGALILHRHFSLSSRITTGDRLHVTPANTADLRQFVYGNLKSNTIF